MRQGKEDCLWSSMGVDDKYDMMDEDMIRKCICEAD